VTWIRGCQVTAAELLAVARAMVRQPRPSTAGSWARAAALLGRQALEAALGDLWSRKHTGIGMASMRSQLLCLPAFLSDAELAGQVSHGWAALSRACHQHPYELAPTAEELERWLDVTEALLRAIEVRAGRQQLS
jgi:hypothetical protein